MSLNVAFRVAQKGISLAEKKLDVVSSNINNASTEGYTRKVYQARLLTTGGVTTPVGGSVVHAAVNTMLEKSVNKQSTSFTYYQVTANYLEQYSDAFGSTGDDSYTLSSSLNSFTTSLQALEENPTDVAAKLAVVASAQQVSGQLNMLSQTLQTERLQVSNDIGASVENVNGLLAAVSSLNVQISEASATNSSVADLEDQRNMALQALSEEMGIQYFTDDNNQVKIYSASGILMASGSYHATLSYDPVGSVTSSTLYPGGFDAIEIAGADITSSLTSGKLGALINLRDNSLVDEQEKLDAIALQLSDQVNALTNQGTSVPPRSEITGYTTVASGDPLAATGTMRVAVTDSDGVVQNFVDIDLTTVGTIGGLVAALNGIPGVSASVNADGNLEINATTSGQGIAINEMDSDVGGKGISHYLGLNNLFEGNNGNPITASNIQLSAFLVADETAFPAGALSSSATLAVGDNGVTKGDGSIAAALVEMMSATQTFPAAGDFSSRNATFSGYVNSVMSNAASKAAAAQDNADTAEATYSYLTDKLASLVGVNVDEETANMTSLQTYYEANAAIMSTIREMYQSLLDAVGA